MEMNAWSISLPARDTLEEELRSCDGIVLKMDMEFVRALPKVGKAPWGQV